MDFCGPPPLLGAGNGSILTSDMAAEGASRRARRALAEAEKLWRHPGAGEV